MIRFAFRYFPITTAFVLFLLVRPVLAAGTAVIDAVPTSAPLISDAVALALIPIVASAFASAFNAWLRASKRAGKKRGPATMAVGAALNTVALNLDQAKRQAQAAAGKDASQ